MEKAFSLGILVGRFQMIHAGHQQMIQTALNTCDEVGIFVGSSQESGTEKNPFTYELREKLLRTLFGNKVHIYPLPDIGVGNNGKWGDYVLQNVVDRFGRKPDLLVSGREERRLDWFDSEAGKSVAELYIPKTIEISASALRAFLIEDDRESWQAYVSPELYPMYPELRAIVMASKDNTHTASI